VWLEEWLHKLQKMVRIPDIVLIQESDMAACSMADAKVAGRGSASVCLMQDGQLMVVPPPFHDCGTIVHGVVIDHDQFV